MEIALDFWIKGRAKKEHSEGELVGFLLQSAENGLAALLGDFGGAGEEVREEGLKAALDALQA